jgi:hypothetical protein
MRFRIGDLIHNNITQEEGRVVRLVEKNDIVSYVVVVAASALRGEIEALWRQYEVNRQVNDEEPKRKGDLYEAAAK